MVNRELVEHAKRWRAELISLRQECHRAISSGFHTQPGIQSLLWVVSRLDNLRKGLDAQFGPEVKVVEVATDATPSPPVEDEEPQPVAAQDSPALDGERAPGVFQKLRR